MKNFNQIKKQSESYAKMMRDLFHLSFENEKLNYLLDNLVYDDDKSIFVEQLQKENKQNDFKNFIFSYIGDKIKEKDTGKSVKELLDGVGYDFFVCKTKNDILQFKKYYKQGELICTYNNIEERLQNYHIFWIVKKDIDKITHQGANKNRQDIYGTSCCSIQILKTNNQIISIKNRYNHNVNNPDATFSNNLDNIAEGLTEAINKEFNLKTTSNGMANFELQNFLYINNKFIYYNYEMNNIYYGKNKIIKNGKVTIYNPNDYLLVDYFLIDLKNKQIVKIDKLLEDDFFNFKFKKIIIKKSSDEDEDEDDSDTLTIIKD